MVIFKNAKMLLQKIINQMFMLNKMLFIKLKIAGFQTIFNKFKFDLLIWHR